MTIFDILKTGAEFYIGYKQATDFQSFLKQPRDVAMEQITQLVKTYPSTSLDNFEQSFLNISSTLIDQNQKQRAMELYAWLKLQETLHYSSFRGFMTDGAALY